MMIRAYSNGYFPMNNSSKVDNSSDASNNDNEYFQIDWYRPDPRCVMFLNDFHISRSLKRLLAKNNFVIRYNKSFAEVVKHCANRSETWLCSTLINIYNELYNLKLAGSVEVYSLENELIGGLFGVHLNKAFFAESMFFLRSNMSKVAMVGLVDMLKKNSSEFFDCQFMNDHLNSMGATMISDKNYMALLKKHLYC